MSLDARANIIGVWKRKSLSLHRAYSSACLSKVCKCGNFGGNLFTSKEMGPKEQKTSSRWEWWMEWRGLNLGVKGLRVQKTFSSLNIQSVSCESSSKLHTFSKDLLSDEQWPTCWLPHPVCLTLSRQFEKVRYKMYIGGKADVLHIIFYASHLHWNGANEKEIGNKHGTRTNWPMVWWPFRLVGLFNEIGCPIFYSRNLYITVRDKLPWKSVHGSF